jgi:lipopolysaccharide/colanic/teichoic acid biosynthesis glycosyltransferase
MRNRLSSSMKVILNEVGDTRMLVLSTTPDFSWSRICKGILDRVLAICLLICSSPIWLVTAIGIKISDPKGPVFFRQRRSGLYGKVFHMWKFRSMYVDAESRLEEIKAKYGNEMNGPIFKLTNDPRIFKFGHFIRKTSIDELPQMFFNILLRGDMSVVGPRPILPDELAENYTPEEQELLRSVKPGLTGYWQAYARSTCSYEQRIQMELHYVENANLWWDIKIIFKTVEAVLHTRGAK